MGTLHKKYIQILAQQSIAPCPPDRLSVRLNVKISAIIRSRDSKFGTNDPVYSVQINLVPNSGCHVLYIRKFITTQINYI